MLIGLHLATFNWPGGPAAIAPGLGEVLDRSESIGIHSFWPMDHFVQLRFNGPRDDPMLEVYSTLAWAAARTSRMQLGALVTGVHHRHPGVLVKTVTTLDVLSGGRAWLGLGAGWHEEESRGLGIPMPAVAERFERLEETLVIAGQMFGGDASPYEGRHYSLAQPLNQPLPVRRPPIMIGGMGERKTLRLVAQYADACNIFDLPDRALFQHKLDVLRGHCEDAGRPYDDVVVSVTTRLEDGSVDEALAHLADLADRGVDLALVMPQQDLTAESTWDRLAALVEGAGSFGRAVPSALRN